MRTRKRFQNLSGWYNLRTSNEGSIPASCIFTYYVGVIFVHLEFDRDITTDTDISILK